MFVFLDFVSFFLVVAFEPVCAFPVWEGVVVGVVVGVGVCHVGFFLGEVDVCAGCFAGVCVAFVGYPGCDLAVVVDCS